MMPGLASAGIVLGVWPPVCTTLHITSNIAHYITYHTLHHTFTPHHVMSAGIVLGKHSGRAALSSRLKQLGYPLAGAELDAVFV
jgi:hypothetical protein